MKSLFDIVLISSDVDRADEVGIVSKLFDAGLQGFHLRKPNADEAALIFFLEALPKEVHDKVVLHSHFHLADRFGVAGIHMNEAHKERIADYSRYKVVSASFHSVSDLRANTFLYKYVFLSPIFDSISKAGYKSQFNLKAIGEELKKNRTFPKVLALGGVTESNIHLTKGAGFSGAAVLGAVWQSDDPVSAFIRIKTIGNQL